MIEAFKRLAVVDERQDQRSDICMHGASDKNDLEGEGMKYFRYSMNKILKAVKLMFNCNGPFSQGSCQAHLKKLATQRNVRVKQISFMQTQFERLCRF